MLDQQRIDVFLREGMSGGFLADINRLSLRAMVEQARIGEVVVDDDIGRPQQLGAANGDGPTSPGPRQGRRFQSLDLLANEPFRHYCFFGSTAQTSIRAAQWLAQKMIESFGGSARAIGLLAAFYPKAGRNPHRQRFAYE